MCNNVIHTLSVEVNGDVVDELVVFALVAPVGCMADGRTGAVDGTVS